MQESPGTYHWQRQTQFSLNQDPGAVQSSHEIANLSLGVKDKRNLNRLTVTVNNLFDKT
jgi:hypothetical protein